MNDTVQQTAAESATEAAVEAHLTGAPPEQSEELFNRSTIAHRRQAAEPSADPNQWRDDSTALALMPEAPAIARSEVDNAIAKLNEIGGDHAALVDHWQTTGANVGEEISYARAAFKSIAENDPDLIARVDASGLGDHPAVLKFLARQGRLDAGMLGDTTISRNHERNDLPMTTNRTQQRAAYHSVTLPKPTGNNNGSLETRGELDRLLASNPPGSHGYKNPAVQSRVQQLHQMLAGSGSVVGTNGRTA